MHSNVEFLEAVEKRRKQILAERADMARQLWEIKEIEKEDARQKRIYNLASKPKQKQMRAEKNSASLKSWM